MIKKFLQKVFKNISYSIFKIVYGKITKSIQSDKDDRIIKEKVKFSNDLYYSVYLVKHSRLYTDRIQDTAILIDNKIVDGASFQLRKNNANSNVMENIVFSKGTPRILKKLKGRVLSLLTGGGGNSNYWHWLYDVLPRLKICEKIFNLNSIDYFLVPDIKLSFQKETLGILNISKEKILTSEKYRHLKANEIITTAHPYMFTNDPHSDAQKIPNWIMIWLKEKFLKENIKKDLKFSKRIYIDRSDSKSNVAHLRTVKNEQEIRKFLSVNGFDIIKLSDLSFSEQVVLFNNAEIIVGLHGSGFANIAFCNPQTKVIEFRNSSSGPIIENIAKKINLNYKSIIIEVKNTKFGIQQGHIHIPIKKLENLIRL